MCYSKDRDVLYQVTPTQCSDLRTLGHAAGLTANLGMAEEDRVAHAASCGERYLRKNHILKMIDDDEDLKRATMSISAHWIDNLLREDIAKAGGVAMPDGLMALSVFLFRGNNQVWPFRAKNWLASEDPPFFLTLVTYGHCLAMIVRNNAAATHFWRLMNLIVLHPVCATVALRMLMLDKQSGEGGISKHLRAIMESESVPDNVQGLVYQTVAIIEEQSEDEDRCGINKRLVLAPLIPLTGGYSVLYSKIKVQVRQYIVAAKSRS